MHHALIIDRCRSFAKECVMRVYPRPLIRSAFFYRRFLGSTKFIAVTGSGGKTTTKDLLFDLLRSKFCAYKSHDSNNHVFMAARTILGLRPGVEYCVQEIGASGAGSLDEPTRLLRPSISVITNVRTDHCKAFENDDAIAVEKAKVVQGLSPDGIAVLNADDERVLGMARLAPGRVLTYGTGVAADLRADQITSEWPDGLRFVLHYRGESIAASAALHGTHLIHCVLAAVAGALAAGMTLSECIPPIRRFHSHLGRMSIHNSRNGIVFVRDEWKSPLWSIRHPIEFMAQVPARRKVLVLGTISDYRGRAYSVYRDTVGFALQFVDEVVMVGEHSTKAARIARRFETDAVVGFETVLAAADYLRNAVQAGDAVLLKGSNPSQHLGRLALMFDEDVRCWRARCGKQIFCENCALVSVPGST